MNTLRLRRRSFVRKRLAQRFDPQSEVAVTGIKAYIADVKGGSFPDDDHSYGVDEKEYEKFLGLVQKRRQL